MGTRFWRILVGGMAALGLVGLIGGLWVLASEVPRPRAATAPAVTLPTSASTLAAIWPPPGRSEDAALRPAPAAPSPRSDPRAPGTPFPSLSPAPASPGAGTGSPPAPPEAPEAVALAPAAGSPTPGEAPPDVPAPPGAATATLTLSPPTEPATATPTEPPTAGPPAEPPATPSPDASPEPFWQPTESPTPWPAPSIAGRLLLNGRPARADLVLILQRAGEEFARATVGEAGTFAFEDVPVAPEGYDVVFSQALNERFAGRDTATWLWIGPVPVLPGSGPIRLPDLELSLQGLAPAAPGWEAVFAEGAVAAETPITFAWTAYPGAEGYWVEAGLGDGVQPAWRSPQLAGTSVAWSGPPAAAGEYWWGVTAWQDLYPYRLYVCSYLSKFTVEAEGAP